MRTTVDVDDRALERAKKHAAATGQTLGAVISAALHAYLATQRAARQDPPFELLVRGRPGGRFPTPAELEAVELEEDLARLAPGAAGRAAP